MENIVRIDDAMIERTAQRFARVTAKRSHYYYVASKLRRDPSTRAIVNLGPLGDLVDLGCGRGHLALLLLESGHAERVRAVDWDAEKIAVARLASEGLDATFEATDVRKATLEPADTVLLVDVLHYLDVAAQDALLAHAADLVRPGGRLVVREATTARGWRSVVTVVVEWISTLVRFNLGERVLVRNVAREYVPVLEAKGMTCTVEPCWRGTPFSNVLLVATKPAR